MKATLKVGILISVLVFTIAVAAGAPKKQLFKDPAILRSTMVALRQGKPLAELSQAQQEAARDLVVRSYAGRQQIAELVAAKEAQAYMRGVAWALSWIGILLVLGLVIWAVNNRRALTESVRYFRKLQQEKKAVV